MTRRAVEVGSVVRQKVVHLGLPGEQWLAGLPGLIADLERQWSITVGRPFTAGTDSYVVRARTRRPEDWLSWCATYGRNSAARSDRVVAQALPFADSRAVAIDLDQCVVVHGDPHPGNALRVMTPRAGAESGFVFVDPDGFLADPGYDLGVVLRDWCAQLLTADAASLARGYCGLLAAVTGVDETAIWEWGFLERVSTGLYLLSFGSEGLGRPFLDTAERLT